MIWRNIPNISIPVNEAEYQLSITADYGPLKAEHQNGTKAVTETERFVKNGLGKDVCGMLKISATSPSVVKWMGFDDEGTAAIKSLFCRAGVRKLQFFSVHWSLGRKTKMVIYWSKTLPLMGSEDYIPTYHFSMLFKLVLNLVTFFITKLKNQVCSLEQKHPYFKCFSKGRWEGHNRLK